MPDTTTTAAPVSTATESTNAPETSSNEPKTSADTTDKAPVSTKKKFMLKVDGEDTEEEIDLADEAALTKRFQQAKAFEKRKNSDTQTAKKAMEIVKSFENEESFLEMIKKHPSARTVAEKFLLEQIQDEMMTPQEKELRGEKKELEQFRTEKKEREAGAEKAALAQKEAKYIESYQKTIIDAIDKSGLPKSPELVKRMAGMMAKSLERGIELDAFDLVDEVKKDLTQMFQSLVGDADGDHLINLFGKDIANKIRKSDLKKLSNPVAPKPKASSENNSDAPNGVETIEEWKERLSKRWG